MCMITVNGKNYNVLSSQFKIEGKTRFGKEIFFDWDEDSIQLERFNRLIDKRFSDGDIIKYLELTAYVVNSDGSVDLMLVDTIDNREYCRQQDAIYKCQKDFVNMLFGVR